MRPILFLLKPSFPDPKIGPGLFYCPHCAQVEGLLSLYPHLRHRLDVRYVDFARPRHEVIAEIGESNQACPVLILPATFGTASVAGRTAAGRTFFVGADEISGFLAEWAGIAHPHP